MIQNNADDAIFGQTTEGNLMVDAKSLLMLGSSRAEHKWEGSIHSAFPA